jgi:hypothetical protein
MGTRFSCYLGDALLAGEPSARPILFPEERCCYWGCTPAVSSN